MKPFDFYNPVSVHFGNGVRRKLGDIVQDTYKSILLVCSQGPFHENGLYDEVKSNLEQVGIRVCTMSDVESNPKLSRIREGVFVCRAEKAEGVLALGSGSAIDCAKAIGAAAAMKVDPYELYWGKPRVRVTKSLDTIMIPTLAATGSEMNRSSVAVNDETKEKYYFDSLFPKHVFMDPEVTATVPKKLTIWGAMDILSHTFEYYFNGYTESEFQSRFSEGIIMSVMENLEKILENPEDLNARGELMWAAAVTWGTGLTWLGRGEPDMACHGIEESFSGYFDTHHGACLGVLTPRWMELAAEKTPEPFARFARYIMKVTEPDNRCAAAEGIASYKEWMKRIDAPNTFFDIGDRRFSDDELRHVARTACRIYGGGVGRLVRFEEEDIWKLLMDGKCRY